MLALPIRPLSENSSEDIPNEASRILQYSDHFGEIQHWLVVEPPLWKIWKSVGMIIPYIMENKECSKPPTRTWWETQWALCTWLPMARQDTLRSNVACCKIPTFLGFSQLETSISIGDLTACHVTRRYIPGYIHQFHQPLLIYLNNNCWYNLVYIYII